MKFLRGKALKIILAICMLTALVCITASAAADYVLSIQFAGTTVTVGGGEEEEKFFHTDPDTGLLITENSTATADDYNVKLVVEGSTAKLYLKGATIKNGDQTFALTVASTTTAPTLQVIVEQNSTISSTQQGIQVNKVDFEVNGPGKLTVDTEKRAIQLVAPAMLTVKETGDLAVTSRATTGTETEYGVMLSSTTVRVIGGKASFSGGQTTLVSFGTGGKLQVSDGADVTITGSICTYVPTIEVTDARLELNGRVSSYPTAKPVLSYEGKYVAKFGSSKTTTEAYTGTEETRDAYYFLTAPAYTATINGTEKLVGVGETVSLSAAATNAESLTFAKWTSTSGDVAFANPYSRSTTFVMPAHDVTVTANFGKQASVTIAGTARTVIQGGAALYFTTNESGAVTPGDDENTYNIKFVYPAEGKPTVFLCGAYINSGSYSISSNANSSADGTVFVVENTKTVTVGEGESAVTVNAYLGKPISWSVGELTVQGQDTGKLKIVTTSHSIQMAGQPLTFKDLDLEITTTADYNGCFNGTPTNLTFDGGKAVLKNTGNYPVYFVSNASAILEGIVITGGADVWMTSANDTIYGTNDTLALKVYSGKLKIETTSSSHSAVRLNSGTIQINGGTVEFYGPAKATYGTYVPVLTGYRNAVDENTYLAVAGASEAGATTYNSISGLSNYKYFKVEPAYTIEVNGGTSSPATKAPEGTTVTLTAPTVTGKVFTGWTVDDGSAEIEIQEDNGVYTFTMPAKNVSVTANYKNQATIKLAGEPYTFSEDRYFTINADGATIEEIILAEGQEAPTNYNIKLAFDDNDIPTVYLKNANLSYTDSVIENGTGTTEFAIETEAPSTLHQTGDDSTEGAQETRGAVKTSGRVIFRGDDLLTLKGNANGMYGSNSAVLLFEGSNVQIVRTGTWSGWYDGALYGSFGEIIFDGGTTEFVAPRFMFYNATTFTIRGGAKLTLSHTGSNANQTTYNASTFNIENGYMYLAANVANAALGSSTINILENGVFEAYNQKAGGSVSTKAPNLFDGYYAVMGASKADVAEYKVADGALSGQYFKAGKAYTVTVEGGTAQSVGAADLTIKAFVGDAVTLIPGEAQAANQRFAGWTFGQGSQEPEITDNVFTMPSGNVTVEATYEVFATMKIMGTGYDFTANGPVYFETAAGSVTKIDPPQNGTSYNIKLAFDDGGIPTVYLKGAHISDASWKQVIANGTNTTQFAIETEADSRIDYTGNAVSTTGELIFRGTGKLTIESKTLGQVAIKAATGGNYDVVFDHANVEIITIGEGGSTINGDPKSVIFNGGSVTMDTEYAALFGGCAGGVQVTNNANVHIEAVKQAFYISSCATITVDSGNLYISSTGNFMYVASGAQLVVNGGAVELISTGNISANASVIINQNYTNALAVSGTSKSDATLFTSGSALSGVSYFKVAPGYDVTVTNGMAKMLGVSGNAIKAFANESVTLTPGAAETGKAFWKWTTEDKIDIASNQFTMIAEDVSVEAVWQNKSTIYFRGGYTYSILEHTPTYLKTVDGALQAATEQDYNIKLIYTDGLPAIHMKNAALAMTSADYVLKNADDIRHLLIVVEADSSITSVGTGITLNKADLTIKGPGKLSIETTTSTSGVFGAAAGILLYESDAGNTITLSEDSNVYIKTVGPSTACLYTDKNSVKSTVAMQGGNLELEAVNRASYPGFKLDLTAYEDWAAMGGESEAAATPFNSTQITTQKYLKIAPGYDVTVENGTTNVARAFAGMKVTVTPAAAADGEGFKYWTSAELLGEDVNYNSSYTFTMPNEPVTVTANYGDLAQVSLRDRLYDAVKGGKTHYYTVADNVITENGDANDYNISFEWAEGADTVPTVTLNNVTLLGSYEYGAVMNGPHTNDLVVRVSGTNTLTQNQGGAAMQFTGNHLVLEGVYDNETETYGTLNMSATNSLLLTAPNASHHQSWEAWDSSKEHTVTIKNVNMNLTDNGYGAIRAEKHYDITIKGGTIALTNTKAGRAGIYCDNLGDLTLNDVNMTIMAPGTAIRTNGTVTISGGALTIGTEENPVDAAFAVKNRYLKISNNAFVEAFASNYVYGAEGASEEFTPDLSGYTNNYVAVIATSKTAFIIDPEGCIYTEGEDMRNVQYFRIEPANVEVTITWGAMTFTYAGSQWNVETLTWEGIWIPTDDLSSPAAGMDGHDPKLASNQIKVVNTGAMTVNVSFKFNSNDSFSGCGDVDGAFKATSVTRKPYYFSNWDPVDSSEFPYIWSKAYFWAERKGTEVTVSYNGKTGISEMAAELKRVFDEYPDNSNMRIMNITAIERRYLSEQTEDCVFMENGVERLTEWVEAFLAEYQSIGGKLDAIHSDLEYINGFYWYLYSEQYLAHEGKDEEGNTITISANTNVYRNIIKNPNYQAKVRPQLVARGFKFETNPEMADFGELYSLYPNAVGSEYTDSQRIWDTVIRDLHCSYLDEAFYKPLLKYYPDAYFSDYQSRDSYGWMKLRSENNYTTYVGGNTNRTGHTSSYNAYNYAPRWVTALENDTSYKKPASYNGAVFEDNAFHMTQWETNNFKSMYAATDTKEVEIALTYYDYALNHSKLFEGYPEGTSSGTAYHIEGYFHAGLLDPEFAGYVIQNEIEDKNDPATSGEYAKRLQVISDIMLTLSRIVGYSDRKPIETPLNWNDSFILSGMYANGRNVWRITPDTISGVSKEAFLVKNDGEVVFYNKGQTITFPQGSIISEPITFPVGTCGYWVETPADVMPIVTNDENRYEEYPAYVETFDNCTVDQDFNSQYSHTWESDVSANSSVTIKASTNGSEDNVLAIQGNASLNNIKLPEYITAGDNYAKQQIWETTFSLSRLPTGSAEAKLLVATSGSGANTDGGFRISNNTLYYSTASGYQAFGGFSLSENTEYTLKRVVDFDAFTCSYYVYDASGILRTEAEHVSMANVQLPVQKIGISTANFDTNTLYVDDYKLYATGVTTDLEVYNADTGIQVDASVARKGNTAYRLSWMNASSDAKIYNVVATYSDDTMEILNSIEMLPGCDGVNTGIVQVADGKTVTITIEETDTKVPDAGDNAGDDGSSNGSNFANGEDTPITLTRFQEADVYLYLSSGYVAVFDERQTLGTVTVTINAITPAQEGGNA